MNRFVLLSLLFSVFMLGSDAYAAPVMPLMLPEAQAEVDEVADRVYLACQKQVHFLLSLVKPWDQDPQVKLLTESQSGEHWIRPNTGTLAGLCFLYRFGAYDESIVGVSRAVLLQDYILPMYRYLIMTHRTGTSVTGDGKPWGDAWQSAHWAHMMGRGGWWIWDSLPADIQEGIRRIIAHEADRFVGQTPPAQIQNDTKAEENAWNAQVLSVAAVLMPDDPRRAAWEDEFQRWAISSFLRQSDAECPTVIDGKPVREQFIGANIYEDFTLENHGIVHPDYMTTFSLLLGNELDYRLTGRQSPEALLWNVAGVYENLKWFSLPDGGFVYPSGQDWRLFRNCDWLTPHLYMAVFAGDPDAWSLALTCLDTLERMQARSDSGAAYLPEEFFFPSTQTDKAISLAYGWLTLQCTQTIVDQPDIRQGIRRFNEGKLILNRFAHAIHTLSWGKKVMFQCLPLRQDRLISPDYRIGIGSIYTLNHAKELDITLLDADVQSEDKTFKATLIIQHGDVAEAVIHIQSQADGTIEINETLTALRDFTSSRVLTGLIGVLNNQRWIDEKGHRTLAYRAKPTMAEKAKAFSSCSGESFMAAAQEIHLENILKIESRDTLSFAYYGAKEPEQARATDRLYLNAIPQEKEWSKGQELSSYSVTLRLLPPQD
ncbi:MAG: hypothetical protein RBU29_07110 [bacterium]|jgi:hypothetical protein|nr:hypothetical protein [bacterium]